MRMKLPGLPLEQSNDFVSGGLCGWWAIGTECVRTGIYKPRTRNLARKVMRDVAIYARGSIDEETFAAVWKDWKGSKQLDTTLNDYVMTLTDNPENRVGDGCTDADLMIAAHWLLHTRPPGIDQPRLFTYREGDQGYKQYCMGRVIINVEPTGVQHETDVVLCNRSSLHWTPTAPINERTG
jgi:hypothetical protein